MKTRGFTFVEICIVGVILALLGAMAIPACSKVMNGDRMAHDQYDAWCKIERREDITFDQWKTLRDAGLLGTAQPRKL